MSGSTVAEPAPDLRVLRPDFGRPVEPPVQRTEAAAAAPVRPAVPHLAGGVPASAQHAPAADGTSTLPMPTPLPVLRGEAALHRLAYPSAAWPATPDPGSRAPVLPLLAARGPSPGEPEVPEVQRTASVAEPLPIRRVGPGGRSDSRTEPMTFQRMFEAARSAAPEPAPRSPGEVAVASGIARFDSDGSVVFGPPAGGSANAVGVPAVQREVTTPAAEPVPASPPAAAATEPDAAAPAGERPDMDQAEVEALADRLLDPLLSRIRAELWIDRERAGLLTEPWR